MFTFSSCAPTSFRIFPCTILAPLPLCHFTVFTISKRCRRYCFIIPPFRAATNLPFYYVRHFYRPVGVTVLPLYNSRGPDIFTFLLALPA